MKNKLSIAKTSCKAFISLLKQYSEVENYYSLSLLRLAQTGFIFILLLISLINKGAGYIGLKRNFIDCKQIENQYFF